jgi:Putative Ig domain
LLTILTPIALLAGGVLTAGGTLAGTPPVLAAAPAAATASAASSLAYACGSSFTPGRARCMVIKNTAAHPAARAVLPGTTIPAGVGYGPSDLQSAYNLTSASATDGAGATVAVIEAYNDPNAESDLNTYRAAAGLPALTAGQFNVYNQAGQTSPLPALPPTTDDWTVETSLDVDMVSAICPLCKIDLVEADNDSVDETNGSNDLFIAEQTAATLGAKYISNSWGLSEAALNFTSYDSQVFGVPGVVYTAASLDGGYAAGTFYPAASPNVVSVGGTTLTSTTASSRGWTESVWYSTTESSAGPVGTGSGCSLFEPQPSWQKSVPIIQSACSNRVENDVAADADPNTGVAVYDTANGNTGWFPAGGTSVGSPIIAAVFALAGNDGDGGNNAADSIYTHTNDLYEVTASNNGNCTESVLCTATGAPDTYNGPTGWGTPDGITAFESVNTITVSAPASQTGTVGTAISGLQISATDSAAGQALAYTATGLPAGLSISSSGLITGTPTTAGTSQVTVTVADTTGASGSASFSWTISAASTAGNTITVTNPGPQASVAGTAISGLQISATDSDSSQTLTYTAAGLPPGLSISSSGLISGTPSVPGLGRVVVTATDTTGASGIAAFIWAVGPPAGSGGSVTNTITVTSPGNQTGTVGTAVSLQISATDSDSGEALQYIAQDLPPGLSVNSSTGLITGTPAIAGTSNVGIIVSDATGAAVSTSFTWTITGGTTTAPACTAKQLLGNAGFDTGSVKPWTSTAGVLAKSKKGLRAQAGNWLARLDGRGAAHKDTLAQKVTIPAACKDAVLTFWVEVHSNVTGKTQQAKNTLAVDVLNASGKVVKDVVVATAADHDTKYVKSTVSLSAYAGQTITIKFIGTEVSGGDTTFLEDSNALNVS